MKTFITKLVKFFFAPVILFLLIIVIYYSIEKQSVKKDLKKISNYECLIMGDSQMQRIKPNLFNNNTYNFSSSGEHFYFTYQKIKKIVSFNDQKIKKIILGVSLPNFGPSYNRLFDLNFSEGQSSLKRYLYFINPVDLEFLNPTFLIRKSVFTNFVKGVFGKTDREGLFISTNKNPDTKTIDKVFKMHYSVKKNENKISLKQIKYLNKIDKLCYENNIKLYLVTLPIESLYKKRTDSLYYNILKSTVKKLDNINYINYLNENIDPSLVSDPVHLNSKGADIYSKKINDSIEAISVSELDISNK